MTERFARHVCWTASKRITRRSMRTRKQAVRKCEPPAPGILLGHTILLHQAQGELVRPPAPSHMVRASGCFRTQAHPQQGMRHLSGARHPSSAFHGILGKHGMLGRHPQPVVVSNSMLVASPTETFRNFFISILLNRLCSGSTTPIEHNPAARVERLVQPPGTPMRGTTRPQQLPLQTVLVFAFNLIHQLAN
jgi:hypothetical protein